MKTKRLALLGSALAALAAPVAAQETVPGPGSAEDTTSANQGDPVSAEEIIVTNRIVFRNRTADPNPVLSYDLEYFQRFEPVSVGEMLKRVPGVTFSSDVLEYDGVQMRGLPAGFTQILINGRRAPGGEQDGTFFVDRLPAELVERIEIIRAPRADQPSEGVAGTLNVVTKESVSFQGGFVKGGMLINEDGGVRPSAALAYAGNFGEATSIWAGVNYQQRRNPKKKVSYRFGGEPTSDESGFPGDPAGTSYVSDPEFDNFEAQEDTRDGTDLSGNVEVNTRFGDGGHFRIAGLAVDTKRDENETSLTYEGEDLDFDEAETQYEDIHQQTFAITADTAVPLGPVVLGLAGGWNAYRENTDVEVSEAGDEDLGDLELVETEAIDIKDDEYSVTANLTYGRGTDAQIKAGMDFLSKTRDGSDTVFNVEDDEAEDPDLSVNYRIREKRYDPYLRLTFEWGDEFSVDAGVRYEITRRRVTNAGTTTDYNAEWLNPSLHLRYSPTAADQFRVSLARTMRRPNYDLISPYEQEESPGDDDTSVGNPALRNERAWGIDAGYERRLGRGGIVGVNVFYRDIKDLIELVRVADSGDGGLYRPLNIGDGKTWGVEFDFSAPLTLFGMPDTGLFANYTYLDSKTDDPFTGEERRFNNQPHHVYNVGFIQTVRSVDASFGASISGRSKALESNFDETISLRYEPDLEAFVEKRFGRNLVLRVSAQNLLDRQKKEDFRKYDGDSVDEILEARADGDLDEYEIERERAGRLFQVTLRAAF